MDQKTMRPQSEEELAALILEARAPLTPVGGATRLQPGEGQGMRLDLSALSGVRLYEPEALTLVVGAGTTLAGIEKVLAAEGQMLAFEPDRRQGSTIGGIAAANASGPRRVQVGACRDAMLGVRFVTGEGEIVKNGGRVMKNVTGYDLVKLLAGSRGTLGVLTEVSLKTAPIPPVSRTLVLAGATPDVAVAALTSALTGPYDISGAGWLAGTGAMIRVEGLKGSVDLRSQQLAARLADFGTLSEGNGAHWAGLVPASAGAGDDAGDLWRIVCLPSEAPALLARLPAPLALDWGGSLIWVAMPAGRIPDLGPFSGQASRVHAQPGAQALQLPAINPVVAGLNAGLRAKFDPRGIFAGAAGKAA